jgi:RimJ/RimL family protein N-acetyltransferase
LLGHDAAVAHWVAQRIPYMGDGEAFGACSAIGVLREDGRLVGGVVYHNHYPQFGNIELSFASDDARWLTRPIICALLSYPFVQLQCRRVTGCTPRRAARALRFLNNFGFRREGVVWRMFGDDDGIISGLRRTYWERSRWAKPLAERRSPIEATNGKIDTKAAACARSDGGRSSASRRQPTDGGAAAAAQHGQQLQPARVGDLSG